MVLGLGFYLCIEILLRLKNNMVANSKKEQLDELEKISKSMYNISLSDDFNWFTTPELSKIMTISEWQSFHEKILRLRKKLKDY